MIACKEEKEDESHSEQKDYRAVCLLYEFFEKSIAFHPYEICENTWMLTMVGDYLSRYRNRKQYANWHWIYLIYMEYQEDKRKSQCTTKNGMESNLFRFLCGKRNCTTRL